jgi:sec-independent protein translocase protein TatA
MPFGIGVWEIVILLLVALLVFGPKRLPEMGRSLGRGMREFKESVTGKDFGEDEEPVRRRQAAELPQGDTLAADPAPPVRERDSAV